MPDEVPVARDVQDAVADLRAVLACTRTDTPMVALETEVVLYVEHRATLYLGGRLAPMWVVYRFPVDEAAAAEDDLAGGDPVSTIPFRRYVVAHDCVWVLDDMVPIRLGPADGLELVLQQAPDWRQACADVELRSQLGVLHPAAAELRELAEQLVRAEPETEEGTSNAS